MMGSQWTARWVGVEKLACLPPTCTRGSQSKVNIDETSGRTSRNCRNSRTSPAGALAAASRRVHSGNNGQHLPQAEVDRGWCRSPRGSGASPQTCGSFVESRYTLPFGRIEENCAAAGKKKKSKQCRSGKTLTDGERMGREW